MSLFRWMPTFLAFPLSGLLAMVFLGPVADPLIALMGGLLSGGLIGGAQWLALGVATTWRWLAVTASGAATGMAFSTAALGAPTSPGAAVGAGLITGLLIGAGQGAVLQRGIRIGALWTITSVVSWGLGWLVTSFVIVDIDRGHVVFGASGAIVATVITGLVLRRIIGPRVGRARTAAQAEARVDA